ncbi:MAG: hypothetical protein BGP21_00985 [Thiobacillus sp. 65-29]|nr:MAG: hypothetical protein BGP21_00985 [Thiobacillus sp. 65-29]
MAGRVVAAKGKKYSGIRSHRDTGGGNTAPINAIITCPPIFPHLGNLMVFIRRVFFSNFALLPKGVGRGAVLLCLS